jgi:hypothetical protein
MEAARDLSDGSVDNLNNRSPGLPLFLILTGATEHSSRTFWFVSLFLHFCGIWLLAQVLYTSRLSVKAIVLFGVVLLLPRQVENAAVFLHALQALGQQAHPLTVMPKDLQQITAFAAENVEIARMRIAPQHS